MNGIYILGLLFSLFFIGLSSNISALSDTKLWDVDADIRIEKVPLSTINSPCGSILNLTLINLQTNDGTKKVESCNMTGKHLSIARYKDGITRWAVRMGDENEYHKITNANDLMQLSLSIGEDRLTFLQYYGNYKPDVLSSSDDARNILDKVENPNGYVTYELNFDKSKKWFGYTDGVGNIKYANAESYASSLNGRYILVWLRYKTYARVDTVTGESIAIGYLQGADFGGPASNSYAGAITNDGKYSFLTNGPLIMNVQNCGTIIDSDNLKDNSAFSPYIENCGITDPYGIRISAQLQLNGYGEGYYWSGNEDSLSFLRYSWSPNNARKDLITLSIRNNKKKTYLALGDSYSSGEGDTSKQSNGDGFYVDGTDKVGQCHVSSQSYPYLISASLQATQFHSVACSGAKLMPDFTSELSAYLGQGNRLASLATADRTQVKAEALVGYKPGLNPQIEYVKQMKPRVVTLTGGGNDVGFAQIITECATSITTCSFAESGNVMKAVLGTSIQNQYASMSKVLKQIHEVSPETTIYVVSYPKFIDDTNLLCGLTNVGALNMAERAAINRGVEYLNTVLKAAAASSGARYINIEDSLAGGRLCETGAYVTGVMESYRDIQSYAESFHPNARGHEQIANTIKSNGSLSFDSTNPVPNESQTIPPVPSVFGQTKHTKAIQRDSITPGTFSVNDRVAFTANPSTFKAFSRVSVSLHSKEKNLGVYGANGDGSLSVSRNIPNDIASGLHTALLEGMSPDGQPIALYQFVYVNGNDPDTDKDGIPNGIDKCQFRSQVFNEAMQQFECKQT